MAIARTVDRRLFFLFNRAHTQLAKFADYHLAGSSGVSTSQAAVLTYLGYHDGCRLSDLANGVGRNNSAITGLVSRMEKLRLVSRKKTLDGRSRAVYLTDEGWRLREIVREDFRSFNEKLTRGLTESEVDAVIKFLNLSIENVAPQDK